MVHKAIILLLSLAATGTCVVWALSFRRPQACGYFFGVTQQSIEARCLDGLVTVSLSLRPDADSPPINMSSIPTRASPRFGLFKDVWYMNRDVKMHRTGINSPAWAIALLLGAYPAIVLIRGPLRRRRRCSKGLCTVCAYNLTGNTSGVCPECGRRISDQDVTAEQVSSSGED